MGVGDRLKHAWNAFNKEESEPQSPFFGAGSTYTSGRPDRPQMRVANERSIIASVYNRIAVDFASIVVRHIRTDENGRFLNEIDSGLNNCLKLEANVDQDARSFLQDWALTLFDKGVAGVVPVDTTLSPEMTGGYDIQTMRVGHVVRYFPRHVRMSVWDDREDLGGRRREVTLAKKNVALVENPFYSIMNEPNSTLQRIIRKLNLLDAVDEQAGSGKLDLIIQLPYTIKSEARQQQAEKRRTDIEMQLRDGKYGIAYTDGTEKITQLNRPTENNLMNTIEVLLAMLHSELGITAEILNGTADEKTMLNYMNRTIEPLHQAFALAMTRTFITKTARSQNQTIAYFRDPFKLVPIANIAEIADKLTRNEILTSNELRGVLGFKPSTDPKADQLQNSNMPAPSGQVEPPTQEGDSQNGS